MFYGNYEHTLDDKGRLVIPRKLREEAGLRVYILMGYDGALSIYKEDAFAKMVEKVNSLPFNKKDNRDYMRAVLSSACDLDVDKLGRVQIPSQILNKYHIGKEVVVIGAGDHMEVWNKKDYQEYEKAVQEHFEQIAEKISSKED